MLDKRFNENIFQKIINRIGVSILKAISYLPFWILYGISDILYLLINYVFKYRKKVIINNLRNSFPEKSDKEIQTICNKFYRHLCDMIFETLKTHSMSQKEFNKRITFENQEMINNHFNEGKSIILLGMHYNNWEWSCFGPDIFNHGLLIIYNPVRGNRAFEDYLLKYRGRWGAISVQVHKSARMAVQYTKMEKPMILWLAADQTPPPTTKIWTTFLNQETPFFSGPEKIASKSNQPVVFHHTRKIKRGHYKVELYELFKNPAEVEEKEILLTYARKMEEIIRKEPEYYLWSHRRWKHTRPEGIELID